jgi:hypothetical protein
MRVCQGQPQVAVQRQQRPAAVSLIRRWQQKPALVLTLGAGEVAEVDDNQIAGAECRLGRPPQICRVHALAARRSRVGDRTVGDDIGGRQEQQSGAVRAGVIPVRITEERRPHPGAVQGIGHAALRNVPHPHGVARAQRRINSGNGIRLLRQTGRH